MGFQIQDGTGNNYSAEVDSKKRLQIHGEVSTELAHHSENEKQAYGSGAPARTATTTGGRYLSIKNTSTTKNLHIYKINVGYDGGATNHDKTLIAQVYWNDGDPSGNNTAATPKNLNRTSGNTAEATVNYWDEVGDGMTVSAGTAASQITCAKGTTILNPDGAIIMGQGDTFSLNIKAEEIGEVTILVTYYFKAK